MCHKMDIFSMTSKGKNHIRDSDSLKKKILLSYFNKHLYQIFSIHMNYGAQELKHTNSQKNSGFKRNNQFYKVHKIYFPSFTYGMPVRNGSNVLSFESSSLKADENVCPGIEYLHTLFNTHCVFSLLNITKIPYICLQPWPTAI